MKKINEIKGITLIALVITIIILLILAGITISSLTGSGLFEKSKQAKRITEYTSAKEAIEMKLMEVETDCIERNVECTIVEIAQNIKDDTKITIEKYYNSNTASIKSGVTERLNGLDEIVVSVDQYSGYKFLIGKDKKIIGITIEEITDTFRKEDFETVEDFEKEVLGKEPTHSNPEVPKEPEEIVVEVPEQGTIDTSKPIELTTYMAIKTNTKNTLQIANLEGASYTVKTKTTNVSLSGNVLTANSSASSYDSCEIQVTGTYSGTSYTNNLIIYVEPKNLTTVTDRNGQQQNAYAIYEAQDLVRLGELTNHSIGSLKNAKMMQDINLSGINWQPMGWLDNDTNLPITKYEGIFDGNEKTIKNMKINTQNATNSGIGFIGALDGGTVKDLKFENPDINSTLNRTGIVAGEATNNSRIERIEILDGNVKSTKGYVGGICGMLEETSEIVNCSNNATVTADDYFVGGIAGYTFSHSEIKNCYNSNKITMTNLNTKDNVCIGGITGTTNDNAKVQYCYNTGEVVNYSNGNLTGGIIGEITAFNVLTWKADENCKSSIENCYNSGKVVSYGLKTGGILGSNDIYSIANKIYVTDSLEVKYKDTANIDRTIFIGNNDNNYFGLIAGSVGSLDKKYIDNYSPLTTMPTVYEVLNEFSETESSVWSNSNPNKPTLKLRQVR